MPVAITAAINPQTRLKYECQSVERKGGIARDARHINTPIRFPKSNSG